MEMIVYLAYAVFLALTIALVPALMMGVGIWLIGVWFASFAVALSSLVVVG